MDNDQYQERVITTSSAALPDKMLLHTKAFSNSTKSIRRCELPRLTWLAMSACSKICRVSRYFQPRARRNRNPLLLRVGSHDRPE